MSAHAITILVLAIIITVAALYFMLFKQTSKATTEFRKTQEAYLKKHPDRKRFDKTMLPFAIVGLVLLAILVVVSLLLGLRGSVISVLIIAFGIVFMGIAKRRMQSKT